VSRNVPCPISKKHPHLPPYPHYRHLHLVPTSHCLSHPFSFKLLCIACIAFLFNILWLFAFITFFLQRTCAHSTTSLSCTLRNSTSVGIVGGRESILASSSLNFTLFQDLHYNFSIIVCSKDAVQLLLGGSTHDTLSTLASVKDFKGVYYVCERNGSGLRRERRGMFRS
jgi:hypothetical protein